ncbi:MAG TPA: transposase [Candidatus Baltobacteraceae bacterium]|nr:transposase [Candidatus Dormibacteraeota bacterium]HVA29360.1 transposase [Candidatus Baltobacteraceae bacterium]
MPLAEKRRLVELASRAGASILAVAHEHGVSRTSLYQWRALYRAGKLNGESTPRTHSDAPSATFLPVTITAVGHAPRSCAESPSSAVSVVHLTLVSGVTLRIETGALDAGLLCALVAALQR